MIYILLSTLLLLLFWHALADYPLQGDFLAKAKNHAAPIPGVPWWQALGAHSLIHAGGVFWITNSLSLAALEFIGHALIDHAKCSGQIGYNTDQALHVAMKVFYAVCVIGMASG
jgi:Protein of unknown function (DUF3307)